MYCTKMTISSNVLNRFPVVLFIHVPCYTIVTGYYIIIIQVSIHPISASFLLPNLSIFSGVVGWCEGAVYLTSLGRPTDIGLQLGKACYPCSG